MIAEILLEICSAKILYFDIGIALYETLETLLLVFDGGYIVVLHLYLRYTFIEVFLLVVFYMLLKIGEVAVEIIEQIFSEDENLVVDRR